MPQDRRRKLLTRRTAILAGAQAALLAVIGGRLYQLQILDAHRYKLLSKRNRIDLRLLAPARGRILDRFAVPLADNRHEYRVVIVAEQAGDPAATLAALARLIPLKPGLRKRVLNDIRRKHSFVPVVIRDDLDWDEVARVEVAIPELPGISIDQGLIRHYPSGAAAAHPVGYVAAVSERELDGDPLLELPDFRIGKTGIEKAQDLALRGRAGTLEVEVNAVGRVVRALARKTPTPGQNVVSTLDSAMQDFVGRRCAGHRSVASLLLDAPSGEVLALVSRPSFDPQTFATGFTEAGWAALSSDPLHPLADRAIAGTYPPGSTFKPVVAVAALSAGVLTPQTRIHCPGYLKLGDQIFHCWKHGGHGWLTVRDAIKESCDVFFYETALRLGIRRLAAMARRFGFGAGLGLDIPGEQPGLMPSPAAQRAAGGGPWAKGETVITGVGQGSVLATPLQLAIMVARLVTGRAIVPRLIRQQGVMREGGDAALPAFASLKLAPDVLALVLDGMAAVVNEPGGTAYAERITAPGRAMGGKSGTAQVMEISEAERRRGLPKENALPWDERDHALFVAFAPVAAPRYVAVAVVEHGGGGSAAAAPICRDLLLEVQRRDPARQVPPPGPLARLAAPPGG